MRAESVWKSFGYAFAGIWHVLRTQRNAQIHIAITVAVILLGLYLHLPSIQWAILVLTIGVVFAAEITNTALEAVVDLASPEAHPLARIAKDSAAGAVLILAIVAVGVGVLILGPPLWRIMAVQIPRP